MRDSLAIRICRHRGSVEDKLVVAAHKVHVDHGATALGRHLGQHLAANGLLALVPRAGGKIQEQIGRNFSHLVEWVGGIQFASLVPDVLADSDRYLFPLVLQD